MFRSSCHGSFARFCLRGSVSSGISLSSPFWSCSKNRVTHNIPNSSGNSNFKLPLFRSAIWFYSTDAFSNNSNSNFSTQSDSQSSEESVKEFTLELGDDVVVSVGKYKGMVLTHIREYYYTKQDRTRVPGKNGVTLLPPDIEKLEEMLDDIDMDISRISNEHGSVDAQFPFNLTNNRKIEVIMRDSIPYIRFEHNSGIKSKSISLTNEQFTMLKVLLPSIKQEIAQHTQQLSKSSTLSEIDLSKRFKVRVVRFATGLFVDLRKVTQTNEQPTFTKNGIALRPQEWELINANQQNIHNALCSGDLSFSLELSPSRRVSFNYFQQNWYVAIREYYLDETSQEMRPGKRGVNLLYDEWVTLFGLIPQVTSTLREAVNSQS